MSKLKRILVLVFSTVLIVALISCEKDNVKNDIKLEQTSNEEYNSDENMIDEDDVIGDDLSLCNDNEVARAVRYGIGNFYVDNHTVTFAEFFSMMDKVVESIDSAKLEVWQQEFEKSRSSEAVMSRLDGMYAVFYAAKILGEDYFVFNTPHWELGVGMDFDWDYYFENAANIYNQDVFGDFDYLLNKTEQLSYLGDENQILKDSVPALAYIYSFGRKSLTSGNIIFDYDDGTNSMQIDSPFTNDAALLAALRLYESGIKVADTREKTEADRIVLNAADEVRDSIINSPTDIEYTGTAYYVSKNGDDSNDGLTPETAWATLDKVNSAYIVNAHSEDSRWDNVQFPEFIWASQNRNECAQLKAGDAVLFERGGLWRGVLRAVSGVTYSAYGEGAKPQILGSPENGAGAEKWSLVEGTNNIWMFHKDMQDCGGILLDETVAIKQPALYVEGEYYYVGDKQWFEQRDLSEFEIFNLEMLGNLRFFNDIRYEENENYPDDLLVGSWGQLYLCCDAGNPGEVYSSIEFFTGNSGWNQGLVGVEDNCVIDNLCVKYGVVGIDAQHNNNIMIQNCEVGWIGGMILGFNGAGLGAGEEYAVVRCGDGIAIGGKNITAKHNYVYQIYDNAITVEGYLTGEENQAEYNDGLRENCVINSNLIENSSGGTLIAGWYAYSKNVEMPLFGNIEISNNIILNIGEGGWAHLENKGTYTPELASMGIFLNPGCVDIRVKNNIVYLSCYESALVTYGVDEQYIDEETFEGNIYVQYDYGNLVARDFKAEFNTQYYVNNLSAEEYVIEALQEDNALVFPLSGFEFDFTVGELKKRVSDIMNAE